MAFVLISFWFDLVLVNVIGLVLAYVCFRRRYNYWKNKGIFSPEPRVPFGNVKNIITKKCQIGESFRKIYEKNKEHPYVGVFMVHRPTFVINDVDLIKRVLVKDFVHFSDHGFHFDEETEPIAGHLFNTTGEKWKNLRTKLTPTFTTNKIKNMFEVVANCSEEMKLYLADAVKEDCTVDVKEIYAKLNTDIIGNCAFGIDCNSFENPDAEFRKMGKRFFEPTIRERIVLTIDFFLPNIITKYRTKIAGSEVNDFFVRTVSDMVKYREKNSIKRNDFLQLLIQLMHQSSVSDETEKGEALADDGTRLTMEQLAAQVFVFFIAGFETSSTTTSFALYELALNPDIQDALREEVDEVLAGHDGKITYDALGEMTYLTKVIEETLRKYPPLSIIFRMCTKDYTLPGTDIVIEKDTPVMIPIWGIQMDPKFFPNPKKFDPERFSPENKATRHHFSYLPFGEGPRICIGSRFGMMQTRLGLVSILAEYEVSVCAKTLVPMEYYKNSLVLSSEGGVFLTLKKRAIK